MSQPTITSDASRPSRRFPKWLIPVGILLLLLFLVVGPVIGSYNGLVKQRNAAQQQFANIDVQLQRRYDLIPNLVNAVQASMQQEQAVFGQIADARTRYAGAQSQDDKIAASNELGSAIGRLLVVMENYPTLQSNQNVQNLMTEVSGTENRIAQERRIYNQSVTDYNNAVQTFPRNITAAIFGFDRFTLIEAAPEAQRAPKVDITVTTAPAAN